MCKHYEVIIENGNSWCAECGTAMGSIFKKEVYLEDEENFNE